MDRKLDGAPWLYIIDPSLVYLHMIVSLFRLQYDHLGPGAYFARGGNTIWFKHPFQIKLLGQDEALIKIVSQ